jgi:hypothetical protein
VGARQGIQQKATPLWSLIHTVRGFFSGLKKRGVAVEVLERAR